MEVGPSGMVEHVGPLPFRSNGRSDALHTIFRQCFPTTTVPTTSNGVSLQEILLAQEAEEEAEEESG